ncbi:MAG: hypothetical protein IKG21_12915 [Atopobiaceae bacterium]|nr:hypothetical protein [Atopobiaceae bacterium]MBR3318711.1 hypothetical protein [Atopobiaceae bacterium]
MTDTIGAAALVAMLLMALAMLVRTVRELDECEAERDACKAERDAWRRMADELSEHAWKLGRECEARRYHDGEWVACRVIHVSHKGGLRVRPLDQDRGGWWVRADAADKEVRFA